MNIKQVGGIMACVEAGKLDEAVNFFRDVLGAEIGPDMPWLLQYGHRAKCAYLGTEAPFEIELAECYDKKLPVGKQVQRIAPAFTMLGVEVENIDEAINELRSKGIRVSDKLKIDDPGFDELYECMIHPKSAFGLIVELLETKEKNTTTGK